MLVSRPVLMMCLLYFVNAGWITAQWSRTNGPDKISVFCFAESPDSHNGSNFFAGTSDGIYRTTNKGISWIKMSTGMKNVQALTFRGTDLFAGTFYDGIFLSNDSGASWTYVNIGAEHCNVNSILVSGNNILAGTAAGVFLSENNGTNWTKVNTGLSDTNITSLALIGTHLFAGTFYNGVFISDDNGKSWDEINTGLTHKFTTRIASFGTNLLVGTHDGAFLSTNYGSVWTRINGGLTSDGVYSFAIKGTNIYAATEHGVFLSTDNGSSWTAFNSGLARPVENIAVCGNDLFAATENWIWKHHFIFTPADEVPQEFSLKQNYPNPFNSSTTIKFSLLNPAHVELIIYNSMGQEIKKLISEYMNAGVYLTEWNASEYPSGVYYCRILTDNLKETKKLLLLK